MSDGSLNKRRGLAIGFAYADVRLPEEMMK